MVKKIEVTDILQAARYIQHQRGKYIKQVLEALEKSGSLTPEVRKAVLDGFNDYARTLCKYVGYNVED